MKRTELRRKKPLKRGGRLRSRSPRTGGRFPKRRDPDYCAWIRTLPCLAVIASGLAARYAALPSTERPA